MATYATVVRLAAPAARVWPVMADVERWPEWTPTVSVVRALDGPELAPGRRFHVEQPKLAPAVWTVLEVEVGRRFVWESRNPGVRAVAVHALQPAADGVEVELAVELSGPFAWLAGLLAGKLTQTYVEREGAALVARVAALDGAAGPT